jgi:hypothetical protein
VRREQINAIANAIGPDHQELRVSSEHIMQAGRLLPALATHATCTEKKKLNWIFAFVLVLSLSPTTLKGDVRRRKSGGRGIRDKGGGEVSLMCFGSRSHGRPLFDDLNLYCKRGEIRRLRPSGLSSPKDFHRIEFFFPILWKGVRTHVKSVGTVTTPEHGIYVKPRSINGGKSNFLNRGGDHTRTHHTQLRSRHRSLPDGGSSIASTRATSGVNVNRDVVLHVSNQHILHAGHPPRHSLVPVRFERTSARTYAQGVLKYRADRHSGLFAATARPRISDRRPLFDLWGSQSKKYRVITRWLPLPQSTAKPFTAYDVRRAT